MPFRTTIPLSLKAFFSVVCLLVLPIALLRGNLFKKTMVVVIANTIMAAAEFPAGLIWVALTGSEIMDYDAVLAHIPEYFGDTYPIPHELLHTCAVGALSNMRALGHLRGEVNTS